METALPQLCSDEQNWEEIDAGSSTSQNIEGKSHNLALEKTTQNTVGKSHNVNLEKEDQDVEVENYNLIFEKANQNIERKSHNVIPSVISDHELLRGGLAWCWFPPDLRSRMLVAAGGNYP